MKSKIVVRRAEAYSEWEKKKSNIYNSLRGYQPEY